MSLLRLFLFLVFFLGLDAWAVENCSRSAYVNYQEVLVDSSSTNRGEGLRYYLQKDPVANQILNEYQSNNRPTWRSASLSTVGAGMILVGFLRAGSGENDPLFNRDTLLFGGLSLIGVSYLISRTNQYNNEHLLNSAVDEYNKRNTPRIYFSPTASGSGSTQNYGVNVSKDF